MQSELPRPTDWIGDPALTATAQRLLGSSRSPAAIAYVTPDGAQTALRGAGPDADFELGSVSKALTGMLYRDLIDRGRVSASTTLGELLPLSGHGPLDTVTLEALATHRSGLPRLAPGSHPVRGTWRLWTRGENPYGETLDELLEQVRDMPVGRPRPAYSNLGFQLLGHALAAAAGTTYQDLLQSTFGDGFWAPRTAAELRPTSLTGSSRGGRPRDPWVGEAIAPAGGIRATIGTMRELLQGILAGTAPGLSALDATTDFSPGVRIGAAWITLGRGDRTLTWHNGATGGFTSFIGVDRTSGIAAVVLSAQARSVDRAGFRLLQEHA